MIGDNVEIGENCVLHSHVSLSGNTKIGKNNIFYPFSSIGSAPQDLKYKGEKSFLIIGNNKVDEFDFLIEELYPDGLTETQLNDILWFEEDWICETLGIDNE